MSMDDNIKRILRN